MALKVLFIGGTGVISSACADRAIHEGHEVFLLTRGQSDRDLPEGAVPLRGDIRDPSTVQHLLQNTFDVVVDWVAFTPEHIETDIQLFSGRTSQYVFISSASVYSKPPPVPVTEEASIGNPFWAYAAAKVACERRLQEAHSTGLLPVTIVRPSHTYDRTKLPVSGRYTVIDRMRKGKPVVVHGDGTSLWTLTHHTDFAPWFTGLLGNAQAVGESYHITSDEVLTWNQIFLLLGQAAGVEPTLVHVPSDLIASYDSEWGAGLLGDKAHSMLFDNTKIKRLVPGFEAKIPFSSGATEILSWFDEDPKRQVLDNHFDQLSDRLISLCS